MDTIISPIAVSSAFICSTTTYLTPCYLSGDPFLSSAIYSGNCTPTFWSYVNGFLASDTDSQIECRDEGKRASK